MRGNPGPHFWFKISAPSVIKLKAAAAGGGGIGTGVDRRFISSRYTRPVTSATIIPCSDTHNAQPPPAPLSIPFNTNLSPNESMSFIVQMGQSDTEKSVPKPSWQQNRGVKNNKYGSYTKKFHATPKQQKPRAPKQTTVRTKQPKTERKNKKSLNVFNANSPKNRNNFYLPQGGPPPSRTSHMFAAGIPPPSTASYFQFNSFPDVARVRHKTKVFGTNPQTRKKPNEKEPPVHYFKPKFDKSIDPVVRNSRLDHCYFKGAFDPLPSPPTYKSPLSLNNVNGLSNKLHGPAGASIAGPVLPPVNNALLPMLNTIPNNKSVFGIARPVSPPMKSQPQSTSYLVPPISHPLIPPITHPLPLGSRLSAKKESNHARHSESSCDDEREPDPQGEETETAPENGEEEDDQPSPPQEPTVDDSVTRCICGFLHDDGFMVQCDKCLVWQHCDCMELTSSNMPDQYYCEECSERKVDRLKAIDIQIKKIKRQSDPPLDSDGNSDSSNSSIERSRARVGTGKRKASTKPKQRAKRTSNSASTTNRRRKPSQTLVTQPDASSLSGGPSPVVPSSTPVISAPPPLTGKSNKKATNSASSTPTSIATATTPSTGQAPGHLSTNVKNILHSNNKRKMITVGEKKQNSAEKTKQSKVLSPLNKMTLADRIMEKKNHTASKRMQKKQAGKKMLINNNNHKRKNSLLLNNTADSVKATSTPEAPAKKEKERGAPPPPPVKEPDSSSSDDESKTMTRWIDNYEEATCNYYTPDLRAKIGSIKLNGSHNDVKLPPHLCSSTQKCRASLLSSGTKILVTSSHMSANQALIEMRGKYLLADGNKNVPSPGSHVFYYAMQNEGLDIIVDSRTYGNDARFVRRSCTPNATMKHCLQKGNLHVYLRALSSINKNSEITVDFSTGGNPEFCCCGNKETCTAAIQKAKTYKERKSIVHNGALTSPLVPTPELKLDIKKSPPCSPLPSPKLASPIVNTTSSVPGGAKTSGSSSTSNNATSKPSALSNKEIKNEVKEEVKSSSTANTSVSKRKEDSKSAIATPVEKEKVEEKPKPPPTSVELDSKLASTTDDVKKPVDTEKKPINARSRKRLLGKRKFSESSQSLESEQEDDEEKPRPVSTRRSSISVAKVITPSKKEVQAPPAATPTSTTHNSTPTKLSREERKIESYVKYIERMEKKAAQQNKQPRARKDSTATDKAEDTTKNQNQTQDKTQKKIVRKRKGRSKSFSFSHMTARTRRAVQREKQSDSKDETSSEDEEDGQSSDSTPTLTQTPSFKLPFTKKSPDHNADSNHDPESPEKPAGGCAKKRWLRQVLSEECESPRPDSPTTPTNEQAGPLKKRVRARASLSSDDKNFTPPTTPTLPDDETSMPPLDTAQAITPATAYACLTTPSKNDLESSVDEKSNTSRDEAENVFTSKHEVDSISESIKEKESSDEKSDVEMSSTDKELVSTRRPPTPTSPPKPTITTSYVPATLETPQELESSLKNSRDFNMPPSLDPSSSERLPRSLSCPVESLSFRTKDGGYPERPSTFCSINADVGWTSSQSAVGMDPPPPVSSSSVVSQNDFSLTSVQEKEKLITKRKLSISEYRQRKGTSLTPTTVKETSSATTGSSPLPNNLMELDDTPEKDLNLDFPLEPVPDVLRVIEKSVMVDDMMGKWSQSADRLEENSEFKDKLLRISKPSEPSVVNNNNNTPKPPKKPDSFLERPKENLTERLNREFHIHLSETPVFPLPVPKPPPVEEISPAGVTVRYTVEKEPAEQYMPSFMRTRNMPKCAPKK